ncbi:hypothetical protein FCIRC_6383 [Fusarium circinatum]|uniref:Uncharacterized protein n=1 Tax=Fusarium circinatum TaxID=48490 RepID=A0A8H5X2H3_FUSCI|nr:hypothetical protein FCIRC_6383 [Fusarium circinatum]
MASSSRNSLAMPKPLAANHSFPQDQLSQIEQLENELKKVVGATAALRAGAPPGKDSATMAGYDPVKRNKSVAILKEIDAIIAGQSTTLTGIDLQDKEAQRRASERVVEYVTGSSENTRVFYGGLGVPVTPATNETAQKALRELAIPNTNPPAQRSDPAKEIAGLKKAMDENHHLITKYKKERDWCKKAWEASKKDNQKLASTSAQQSADLYQARKDLEKARREYPQLERDKANRNESYLKAQVHKAEAKARDDEERAKTAEGEKGDLEITVRELNDQVKGFRASHSDQITQISSLSRGFENRGRKIKDLEMSSEKANALVQRLQSELKSSREDHLNEVGRLQTAKSEVDKRVQEVSDKLRETQIDHSNVSASLISANEKVSKVRGEYEALQLTAEGYIRDLERKNQRISELEKASDEKDASIKVRDETINTHIQSASTFLRHLSSNVESDTWKGVAERVLVDSASTSLTLAEWQPWVIFPSWSGDVSLVTWEDTRGPEAVTLNLLVILKDKSVDTKDLLALLHHLKKAMEELKSMVTSVAQLLLEALCGAVGDSRLHLMHRFAMCQIVSLLGSNGEVQQFMQAMDAADPRIQRLVNALGAYRLNNSVFPMEEAIIYPGVALVGFNRDPQGVIAVSPADNGICWIDSTNIRAEFTLLKVVSGKGDSIELPLDRSERVHWAMTHT